MLRHLKEIFKTNVSRVALKTLITEDKEEVNPFRLCEKELFKVDDRAYVFFVH